MPVSHKPLTFRLARYRADKTNETVHCYLYAEGRGTLNDFLTEVRRAAPGLSWDEITVSPGTTLWSEPPTDAELADWQEHDARAAERSAKWEHETYERLRSKFERGGGT